MFLQGNVVTQYRCGGWKNVTFTRHKFLLVIVKEWLKSVLNYRRYLKNKMGYPVFRTTLYTVGIHTVHGIGLIMFGSYKITLYTVLLSAAEGELLLFTVQYYLLLNTQDERHDRK